VRFQNGSNKVTIELRVVQFWSKIILVNSNRTHTARSFDFEIMRMISDQIALHSVHLPLVITVKTITKPNLGQIDDFEITLLKKISRRGSGSPGNTGFNHFAEDGKEMYQAKVTTHVRVIHLTSGECTCSVAC